MRRRLSKEPALRSVSKVRPPFAPMEALSVDEIPVGDVWQYEPKWDGFRCLLFRDGDNIQLQSKAGKPLTRYFPDLVDAVRKLKDQRFVLDGEIAVPKGRTLSFDALLQRIHPAASRVAKLAKETPAVLIVFDLLSDGKGSLANDILPMRRKRLEAFAKTNFTKTDQFRLSPSTTKLSDAKKWLSQAGGALDGVIAKRSDVPYLSGSRNGMQKIKNYRSADCVVGGFRYNEGRDVVGSLLLGLYDSDGRLNHVGFTSNIPSADKPLLTKKLERLIEPPGFTGNAPGGPSRWSSSRATKWLPLKPTLVVEVSYDHYSGGRFRHGTSLIRFRPDKDASQCKTEQVTQKQADLLKLLK